LCGELWICKNQSIDEEQNSILKEMPMRTVKTCYHVIFDLSASLPVPFNHVIFDQHNFFQPKKSYTLILKGILSFQAIHFDGISSLRIISAYNELTSSLKMFKLQKKTSFCSSNYIDGTFRPLLYFITYHGKDQFPTILAWTDAA
jgi:hypothetical protein